MMLNINDTRYLVKRVFPLDRVKDMELLKEVKGFWGATNVIVQKSKRTVYLVERIEDANILEEWTDEELSDNTIKELTSPE